MKIPLAFTELGYFYPIGEYYHFVQVDTDPHPGYKKYYCGTWEEFKNRFPYTVYDNGANCKFRKRTNK